MDKDDKVDKKEGLFKRMKSIKNKIKGKNEEQSEPIKNQSNTVDKNTQRNCAAKRQIR